MGRFGKSIWAAALWPTILLVNQVSHAQSPLCCSVGQSRMECLEQREKYWTQGIVCQELPKAASPLGPSTTITAAPTVESPRNSSLPLCCTREQSRMECLEQRENNWNQGIACQDPPATSIARSAVTPPGLDRDTKTSVDSARAAALPPSRQAAPGTANATTPSSTPGAVQLVAPVAPVSAAASVKTSSVPPASDSRPLSAKSDLPPCCSKGQSHMDCLEERERKLTMGIACQGGK